MQIQYNLQSPPNKHNWNVWWELIRPHTLTAAFVPVLIGTVLALLEGEMNVSLLAAMMVASILIQATQGFMGKTEPSTMMSAMKATAQTNTFFGLLMTIGLFISYLSS